MGGLRPAYGSGEDWNWQDVMGGEVVPNRCARPTGRARIGTPQSGSRWWCLYKRLRPAYGSGEDWNTPERLSMVVLI